MTDDAEKPRRLVTRAEFARSIYQELNGKSCSKAYLSKDTVAEMLKPAMVGKLLDADIALELFRHNADPARQYLNGEGPADEEYEDDAPDRSLFETKKQSAQIDLQMKQLALQRELGRTLPKDDVKAAIAAAFQVLREKMKARNRRISSELAGLTDAREIQVFLDKEDRDLQVSMVHDIRGKLDDAIGEDAAAGDDPAAS